MDQGRQALLGGHTRRRRPTSLATWYGAVLGLVVHRRRRGRAPRRGGARRTGVAWPGSAARRGARPAGRSTSPSRTPRTPADRAVEAGGMLLHGPDDDGCGGLVVVALDAGGAASGCGSPTSRARPGVGRGGLRGAGADEDVLRRRPRATPTSQPTSPAPRRCTAAGLRVGAVVFAGDALPHWLVHFAVSRRRRCRRGRGRRGRRRRRGPGRHRVRAPGRARRPVGGAVRGARRSGHRCRATARPRRSAGAVPH